MKAARAFAALQVNGALVALGALHGCIAHEPELSPLADDTPIAVIATPTEAAPGSEVALELVVAGPAGTSASPEVAYAFCTSPRAPGENGAVSQRCAERFESPPQRVAGTRFTVTLPAQACRVFGPEVPAGTRPEAADESGGYYQPLRISVGNATLIHRQRIQCALANAPASDTRAYARDYVRNRAPAIAALTVSASSVVLEVVPGSAERYLRFDPVRAALDDRRERLSVRWWSAGGPLPQALSDVIDDRAELGFSGEPPRVIWAVLMDERGGIAVHSSETADP